MLHYEFMVTPEMVYAYSGKGVPVAPKGYEICDFRIPRIGEWVLYNDGVYQTTNGLGTSYTPWLICRPIPKRKVVTFRETGEFRLPKVGEWAKSHDGLTYFKVMGSYCVSKFAIVTRTETEE